MFSKKLKDAIKYYKIIPLNFMVVLTSQLIALWRQKFLKEEPFEEEAGVLNSSTRM